MKLYYARAVTIVTVCSFLAGCKVQESGTVAGNLGEGKFEYKCASAADSACRSATEASLEFPDSIAEGSRFRLAFESYKYGSGTFLVRPISQEYLKSAGDTFRTLKAGYAGVYVRGTVDGKIVDYTLLHVVPVQSLRIKGEYGEPAPTKFEPLGPEEEALTVEPRGGQESGRLAGALEALWESSNSAVVELIDESPASVMHVRRRAPGKATIAASVGGVRSQLEMTVGP